MSVLRVSFFELQQFLTYLQTPEVLQALQWSRKLLYVGYLLLYPFTAIVLVLLYIDLKLTRSHLEKSALRNIVTHLLSNDSEETSLSMENSTDPH